MLLTSYFLLHCFLNNPSRRHYSVLLDDKPLSSLTTHPRPQWQHTLVLNDNTPSFSVRTKSPTHCSNCTITNFVLLKQGNKRSWGGISRFLCPFRPLTAPRSSFLVQIVSTPLSCRGAGGESFSRPLYILYNKVYPPLPQLLLSLLPSFFLFFLKNLSHSFAGLRKSHTFALAKREHLLRAKLEDVFVALRRKSSLTDFHRQKL